MFFTTNSVNQVRFLTHIKMKPQLEKKENTKEEIERERKKMGMRGQTNQIWCYQSAEVFKNTPDHRVKSYIYSERASFDIAFWVISELLQLSMELHANIRK